MMTPPYGPVYICLDADIQEKGLDRGHDHIANDYYMVGVGSRIDNPAIDYVALAQSFGVHAEGPVTDPQKLQAVLRRAAEYVLTENKPALVDVICGTG